MQRAVPRSGVRVAAVAMAFLLPVLFSPSVSASAWTPRAALLLFVIAVGLPRLPALLRSELRTAALAAAGFLLVAAISAAFAHTPALAVFGLFNWGTGWLFIAALVAGWSLGASVAGRRAIDVEGALLAALGINVVVALVQAALDPSVAPFTRYQGRSAGLLGNPVHLATFCVASFPLLLPRLRSRPLAWGAGLALVSAALELSGSRFALGLAVVVVLFTLVRERGRALAAVAALGVGILLGVAVGAIGGATTGTGRVQAGAESVGVTPRLHTWASARHSILQHPLLGVGPGQFRSATSSRRDLALVRAEGVDRYFIDAHDMVVEYATTTGLVGLAALAAWILLAGRQASGPLLGFAVLVLAMHLVEPQFVGTTPLAFLALGAAARPRAPTAPPAARAATALLVTAALAGAGLLVAGDFNLDQARLDFRAAPARLAVRLLPPWPDPPQVAGRVALFQAIATNSSNTRDATLRWRRRAVARDPTNPVLWSELAEAQLYFGQPRPAEGSFRQALRWDPWSVRALNGLGQAALSTRSPIVARAAFRRSLLADPKQPKVRRLLAGITGHQ